MDLLSILIALAIPAAAGTAFVSLVLRDSPESLFERLFCGYGAGLGLLTYEMFILGAMKVPFTVFNIASAQFGLIAILLFLLYLKRGVGKKAASPPSTGLHGKELYISAALLLWVLVKLCFVFYETLNRPIYSWDTWANWSAGAKIFFYSHSLLLDPADENFFGKGYRAFLGHPLHSPLLQVWVSLWLGRFHEVYVKSWTFFYFVSMLGLFYYAIRREANPFYGIVGVFFMASAPILTYHAQDAYSDLPLSWYAFAAAIALLRYMGGGDKRFLMLSGVFVGMGMFVKNEGLFFLIAVSAALVAFSVSEKKPLFKNLLYLGLPVVLTAGPWFIFKAVNGLGYGHGDANSGFKWLSDPTFAPDAPQKVHWEIFASSFKEIFFTANFNLVFPFWIVLTIIGFKEALSTNIKYLSFIILSVMAMFFFVYLTLEVTTVTESTGIQRNILTYAPIVFLTSALLACRIYPRRN